MIRVLSIVLATLMLAATAVAQTGDAGWPDRPIRLVVPFPAGSSTDIVARIVAQKLGQRLGQQIVVENRAGASGNIGVDAVAKAAPDGYTIGIATASTQAVAVSLGTNLPYDPVKDFAPVAMIGSQPYVLVLYPGLPAQDLAQLIALAKAKPGALNYGSAGVASLAHLATALFASMAGVNMTHVPYKSSAQSMTDMITGRLDMQFATIAPSLPNIRAGQLRALVTSGKTRVGRAAGGPDRGGVRARRLRSRAVGRARRTAGHAAGHHRAAQSRGERDPRYGRGQRSDDRARHGARARAAASGDRAHPQRYREMARRRGQGRDPRRVSYCRRSP